ncbi:MAG: fibronectin type III domain-containing protein [Paludibacteraceae bacterium]|nr:fibronectin type III domain-containing protein [Paludibacteraceae bacterium]
MKKFYLLFAAFAVALTATAANHYVSQATGNDSNDGLSWATAKAKLASGFSACSTGDTLFVAAGTYNERVTIKDGSFISILGGYDAASGMRDPELFTTIIDGSDLGKCLLKAEKESTIPLLYDGLTLINADYSSSSSAMYMRGNMTINNCIIRNCHSGSSGGAIYVDITDLANHPSTISNCIFESCSASGGGGAIYNKGANIINCIFRGCEGVYAVIYNKSGNITNCVFHNNAALEADWPNSGGVYNPGGIVTNCTFANNWGTQYAGIHSENLVYNSVFWGNKAEDGFTDPVNYIGGSGSSNNIADQGFGASSAFLTTKLNAKNDAEDGPRFVAPTNFVGLPKNAGEVSAMQSADFSIEKGSYLIDKGKAAVAPDADLAGVARTKGSGPDVGAYEFDPDAAPVPLEKVEIYQDTLWTRVESVDALMLIFTPRKATNKAVTWSIDNPAVATIDENGAITGISIGTTVARVVSKEGGFKDTAVVVVEEKLPIIYPVEVLEADEMYKAEDYTVPSFIPFLIAKETARVDSFLATDAEKEAIAGKIQAMYAAAENLVPKTEPYNMVANINGDPATRMAFCWFTNEGVTEGKVQLLPYPNMAAEDFKSNKEEIINIAATPKATGPLHYGVSTSGILKAAALDTKTAFNYVSHKAIAENLEPGRTYSWRVGYDGHWSPIAQFRTKDAKQGEYSFIYMSDSHIQDAEYVDFARRCATAAAATVPEARFCLFPGDFVETGTKNNSEWEWERWFEESIRPVIMQMPIVPTDGNHDDSPMLNYDFHFNTDWEFASKAKTKPQFSGITYSFVYGDILFLVYSLQDWWHAEGSSESSMMSTYLSVDVKNWFKEQIAKHPDTKYRVTLSHKNIFSGSGHSIDNEIPLFRNMMLPILKECEIDLAIQGHDHCYEVIGPVDPDKLVVVDGAVTDVETVPVNTNTNMTGKQGGTFTTDDGTLYFIGATCGRKRYYPYSEEKMVEAFTTDRELLFDGKHHNVPNYFQLFTGMFGQPGNPSFTKFTVRDDCIEMNSYVANEASQATLFNTMRVKRTKEHTVPEGFEDMRVTPIGNGEKFIRDGQVLIRLDGETYNVLGERVE